MYSRAAEAWDVWREDTKLEFVPRPLVNLTKQATLGNKSAAVEQAIPKESAVAGDDSTNAPTTETAAPVWPEAAPFVEDTVQNPGAKDVHNAKPDMDMEPESPSSDHHHLSAEQLLQVPDVAGHGISSLKLHVHIKLEDAAELERQRAAAHLRFKEEEEKAARERAAAMIRNMEELMIKTRAVILIQIMFRRFRIRQAAKRAERRARLDDEIAAVAARWHLQAQKSAQRQEILRAVARAQKAARLQAMAQRGYSKHFERLNRGQKMQGRVEGDPDALGAAAILAGLDAEMLAKARELGLDPASIVQGAVERTHKEWLDAAEHEDAEGRDEKQDSGAAGDGQGSDDSDGGVQESTDGGSRASGHSGNDNSEPLPVLAMAAPATASRARRNSAPITTTAFLANPDDPAVLQNPRKARQDMSRSSTAVRRNSAPITVGSYPADDAVEDGGPAAASCMDSIPAAARVLAAAPALLKPASRRNRAGSPAGSSRQSLDGMSLSSSGSSPLNTSRASRRLLVQETGDLTAAEAHECWEGLPMEVLSACEMEAARQSSKALMTETYEEEFDMLPSRTGSRTTSGKPQKAVRFSLDLATELDSSGINPASLSSSHHFTPLTAIDRSLSHKEPRASRSRPSTPARTSPTPDTQRTPSPPVEQRLVAASAAKRWGSPRDESPLRPKMSTASEEFPRTFNRIGSISQHGLQLAPEKEIVRGLARVASGSRRHSLQLSPGDKPSRSPRRNSLESMTTPRRDSPPPERQLAPCRSRKSLETSPSQRTKSRGLLVPLADTASSIPSTPPTSMIPTSSDVVVIVKAKSSGFAEKAAGAVAEVGSGTKLAQEQRAEEVARGKKGVIGWIKKQIGAVMGRKK